MELVVGMTIMVIFMVMFTAAMVMMYNVASKTEAIADTSSNLSIAFGKLDTSLRYAAAISDPTLVNGNWYVEWLSTYSGTPVCTQLRLNDNVQQLQQRTWHIDADGAADGLTPWIPLAPGTTIFEPTASETDPFTVQRASDTAPYQQLTIHIRAQADDRTGTTTSQSDVTFTAFNSSHRQAALATIATTASAICTEVARS